MVVGRGRKIPPMIALLRLIIVSINWYFLFYILCVINMIFWVLTYTKHFTKRTVAGVRCQDTVEGFRCGPCPEGFVGDGQRCRPRGCDLAPCSPGRYTMPQNYDVCIICYIIYITEVPRKNSLKCIHGKIRRVYR